jgi:protein-S-isoprenylcysteine O-methyltransferase Ste14
MGIELVFKTIFFALFVAVMVIRVYFGWKVRQVGQSSWSVDKDAVDREGRWSMLLRPVLLFCTLILVVSYVVNSGESSWLVVPLPSGFRWIGVGFGVASLPLLIWVHHTLGRHWSTTLQLRKRHALITSGPYRWVRPPMYMVLILFFTGLSLVSAVWPFILLVALSIIMFYRVTAKEEAMMLEQFGDAYRAYMERTGRFLPRLLHELE